MPESPQAVAVPGEPSVRPCNECMHFDVSYGMCTRKFVFADIIFHRAPPMRSILWDGEDACGIGGRWFEPALPKALEMQGAATIAIQWAEELEAIHAAKQTPNN